jgi:SEC-C motif domain protein
MIRRCPCGNALSYARCCQPIHQNQANAKKPVQLMRARYCAHVLHLVDFVVKTYHPDCNAEQDRIAISESVHSDWCALEIISTQLGSNKDEGYVHFKAYLNQNGQRCCLEENSRFIRQGGLWYYIDGQYPDFN